MNIGFTGSREGMSAKQKNTLLELAPLVNVLHYGVCVGADYEAAGIIAGCWSSGAMKAGVCRIVGHPANDTPKETWANHTYSTEIRRSKAALERNKDIVNECDILIAAPRTLQEEQRSGTWSCIRYARKVGKPVVILDP